MKVMYHILSGLIAITAFCAVRAQGLSLREMFAAQYQSQSNLQQTLTERLKRYFKPKTRVREYTAAYEKATPIVRGQEQKKVNDLAQAYETEALRDRAQAWRNFETAPEKDRLQAFTDYREKAAKYDKIIKQKFGLLPGTYERSKR